MQTFNVKGMTCGHCERAVVQAIQSRDAGATVDVELETGKVEVESQLDAAAIREAIESEGYQVE